jgi:copper oxidase (laccase) domain-containing protein
VRGGNPSMPRVDAVPRDDRWFFDGWASARDQLIAAGLAPAHVFLAEMCTASHPDLFCSYRRDGAGAGRLAAAIRPWRKSEKGVRPLFGSKNKGV